MNKNSANKKNKLDLYTLLNVNKNADKDTIVSKNIFLKFKIM